MEQPTEQEIQEHLSKLNEHYPDRRGEKFYEFSAETIWFTQHGLWLSFHDGLYRLATPEEIAGEAR